MREIRMLRARRRGLETELRMTLNGHEGRIPDTAKGSPKGHRASPRPYQRSTVGLELDEEPLQRIVDSHGYWVGGIGAFSIIPFSAAHTSAMRRTLRHFSTVTSAFGLPLRRLQTASDSK